MPSEHREHRRWRLAAARLLTDERSDSHVSIAPRVGRAVRAAVYGFAFIFAAASSVWFVINLVRGEFVLALYDLPFLLLLGWVVFVRVRRWRTTRP